MLAVQHSLLKVGYMGTVFVMSEASYLDSAVTEKSTEINSSHSTHTSDLPGHHLEPRHYRQTIAFYALLNFASISLLLV